MPSNGTNFDDCAAVTMRDLIVRNKLSLPALSITNDAVTTSTSERLDARKKVHQKTVTWSTATTSTTLAAVTRHIYTARAAGTITAIAVHPDTIPTGGDLAYAVDIQKAAAGSGSYSTVQSGVINVTSSGTDETLQASPGITSAALVSGDKLRVVVTVSGSTGTQGSGATVKIVIEEKPFSL